MTKRKVATTNDWQAADKEFKDLVVGEVIFSGEYITSDRFSAMLSVGMTSGTRYRWYAIDMEFERGVAKFFTELPGKRVVKDANIFKIFNEIDAEIKRQEEKARIKVGVDAMVFHKGAKDKAEMWKDGKVLSLSADGNARVKIGKGQIDVPKDEICLRICANTEENKKLLEDLIEYEVLLEEAVKNAEDIRGKIEWFKSEPFIEVKRQEDLKAAEEAAKLKAEEEKKQEITKSTEAKTVQAAPVPPKRFQRNK